MNERREKKQKEERISAAGNHKPLPASPLSRLSRRPDPERDGATKWIMGGGKTDDSR